MKAADLVTGYLDIWIKARMSKPNGGRGSGNHANGRNCHGIQKLRELILELAVRGKLVPQNPDDEPASELLKKIAQEKERLIKEGKIKQPKPLPEIREDEKPFELPKGWEWERLGNIGDTNIGLTYSPKDIADEGIPVLRANSILNGKLLFTGFVRVNIKPPERVMVNEGDLLICARSGSRALVGKTAIVSQLPEKMAFGAFMAIFKSRLNNYIYHFINSQLFRQVIDEVNTTTINQITQGNLRSTLLPIPPLLEQHRIVAKVDELMALCDQLEQEQADSNQTHQALVETLLANLADAFGHQEILKAWKHIATHFDILFTTEQSIDQLKQTILQLAVMGKLVPQEPTDEPASVLLKKIAKEKERLITEGKIKKQKPFPKIREEEKPFELPMGWVWVRFGDIVKFKSKLVKPADFPEFDQVAPDSIEKGSGKLLFRRTVRESGVRSPNNRFYSGQILYSKIRPSLSKAIIAPFDGLCSADMYPLESMVNSEFLLKGILSEVFLEQVRIVENRIKMPKINVLSLSNITLPLPPLPEQHRIVDKVDELMTLCDALKDRLSKAGTIQVQLADAIAEKALNSA